MLELIIKIFVTLRIKIAIFFDLWDHGGSVVECLTRDQVVCGFKLHRRHCFVSLSKTLYPLLSTGSTQED